MTETIRAAGTAHCRNGGCRRPLYRTQFCFRCWAGTKWVSIWQRIQNKNGNTPSYVGVTLGFMKADFIQWVLDNPPPEHLDEPSIDRIINELGYAPGNIRWIERRYNSAGTNKDLAPQGLRKCSKCSAILPANNEHFPRTVKHGRRTLSTMCKPCNRVYQYAWAKAKEARHVIA